MAQTPLCVIQFWRDEVGAVHWYDTDPALVARVRVRFEPLWRAIRDGGFADWQETPEGALATLIVLDQFPRNMFRGLAEAFSTDAAARAVATRAIAQGFDKRMPTVLRIFFYLPLMHSEHIADQDQCVALVGERLGKDSPNYPFARGHRDQIVRFGRFPGRNAALGRATTPEEQAFLNTGLKPH